MFTTDMSLIWRCSSVAGLNAVLLALRDVGNSNTTLTPSTVQQFAPSLLASSGDSLHYSQALISKQNQSNEPDLTLWEKVK